MNNYIRHLIVLCIAILAPISMLASKNNNDKKSEWTANQRKAEYIYLEGLKKKTEGKTDSFFEFTRIANRLDPENTTISYYLGYCYILMCSKDDTELINESLSLMRAHIDKNPADYFESFFYADINSKLGYSDEAIRVWKVLSEIYPTNNELRFQLADGYTNAGKFDNAIEAYNNIETTQGVSPALALRKFHIYYALKDTTKALNECNKLLDTAPQNIKYNLLLGDIYLELGKPDSAIAFYEKAEKIEPENGLVYLSKAEYYNHIGDSAKYENQIYKAIINPNIVVENKLDLIINYIRKTSQESDSSSRIEDLFNILVSLHPHEIQINQLYSKYLLSTEKYAAAAEQLSYVLDIEPTNAEEWKRLMFAYLLDENFPKALDAAQKSLTYNPDNIELYQYIAPVYFQMKEYDKALETYNEALEKIDSKQADLRSNLYSGIADVYNAKGDTLKAFENYDIALEIFPSNDMALNNFAYHLAIHNTNLDKAERMSALAVKNNPENAGYIDTYAWVFFKKGDYKLAKFYMESAIKLSKTVSAELFEHYGDILFMNGEPENAVEQWEKALELTPDSEILNRKVKHRTYFYK